MMKTVFFLVATIMLGCVQAQNFNTPYEKPMLNAGNGIEMSKSLILKFPHLIALVQEMKVFQYLRLECTRVRIHLPCEF
jgi:hypothetical protein